MAAGHHFPPPWSVEEQDGCFVIRDCNGQALSCIYFKHKHGQRSVAALFTRDEARWAIMAQICTRVSVSYRVHKSGISSQAAYAR
jgi:hypothetical protein